MLRRDLMQFVPVIRLVVLLLAVVLVAVPAAASAATPGGITGPDGRAPFASAWGFRADPEDQGLAARWFEDGPQHGTAAGWAPVAVPHAFNAEGRTRDDYLGSVGWYRQAFTLPAGAPERAAWRVRFESVNHRATVWLNGIELAQHEGAWLPWEVELSSALRRGGLNTLVVRVDSRRGATDVPPLERRPARRLTGGWWNYGGLLRSVTLRAIDRVDIEAVEVRGDQDPVEVRVTLHSVAAAAETVDVTATEATRTTSLGTVRLEPRERRVVAARVALADARRWSPGDPALHQLEVRVIPAGPLGVLQRQRPLAVHRARFGLRRIELAAGRLLLDGAPLSWRGVGLHEDAPDRGAALRPEDEERLLQRARAVGATLIRTHYPLSPTMLDRADELGILVWSEVPVYLLSERMLGRDDVRARALGMLAGMVATQRHHPSVITWSVANELDQDPGPNQDRYLADAGALARSLDPSRPVAIAVGLGGGTRCRSAYAAIDLLGFNEYWGWYGFRTDRLGRRLDAVRRCHPEQAIAVTEFGAEANRDGPRSRKGTYAFQSAWTGAHLAIHGSKPWLTGTTYWALQDFRVRPDWAGGNPRPTPPFHHKGLFARDGRPKPAMRVVQRAFR